MSEDQPKIVSIDGAAGAALQLRLMKHVEEARPGFLADVDILAGSSDSCVISLYLAKNLTGDHQRNLQVMEDCIRLSDDLIGGLRPGLFDLVKFASGFWPLKSGERMKEVLESYLGKDATMNDLKKKVLTVSLNVAERRPVTVRNFGWDWEQGHYREHYLVDVALHSCALPLWVPVRFHQETQLLVDGSLVANNPTMTVVTNTTSWLDGEGIGIDPWRRPLRPQWKHLERLTVLSLAACEDFHTTRNGVIDWGYWRWLLDREVNLFAVFFFGVFQGASEEVHNQASHLLGGARYLRLCPRVKYLELMMKLVFGRGDGLSRELNAIAEEYRSSDKFKELTTWWLPQNNWGGSVTPAAAATGAGAVS